MRENQNIGRLKHLSLQAYYLRIMPLDNKNPAGKAGSWVRGYLRSYCCVILRDLSLKPLLGAAWRVSHMRGNCELIHRLYSA
jgi:hypothetical protein